MENFLARINQLSKLNDHEISDLLNIIETNTYEKGDDVLKLHQTNKKLYFIKDGLVKISFFREDKEFVMNFFFKNEFCALLDSLTTGQPSHYSIIALDNITLTEINFTELKRLAFENPAFERIISGITSMATRMMMRRIRELLETDASKRYANFIKRNGHLINLISLKDLAGYLGITQVSLSRIRAQM